MTFEDLIEAILDKVWRRTKFHGFYLYEVVEDHSRTDASGAHEPAKERLTVRKLGDVKGLPDQPTVEKRYGMHGQYAKATVGDQVLVGFEGGVPSHPFIAFRLPSNPEHVLVDADSYIQIGTADAERPDKRVYVGSTERKEVARKGDLAASGVIQFIGGAGILTIKYLTHDGVLLDIGTLAGTGLAFTPGVDGPFLGVQGAITTGSEFFRSQ